LRIASFFLLLALAYNGSKDGVIFPFINVLRTLILMGNSSQHLIERIRINHGPKCTILVHFMER
jgi:hypothetical protein